MNDSAGRQAEDEVPNLRWRLISRNRKERMRAVQSSNKMLEVFDDKFSDAAAKRYFDLESGQFKLLALQAPIFLTLALSLVPVSVGIGPFSALENSRELLLMVSLGLAVILSVTDSQMTMLRELIKTRYAKRLGDNKDAIENAGIAHGFSFHWSHDPDDKSLTRSFSPKLFSFVNGLAMC
jgi:hypothetical protein